MNQPRPRKDQIFINWGEEEVHTSLWFKRHKVARSLIHRYESTGLIKGLGGGAYVKANGLPLNWQSAILTAQTEVELPIHVGGHSVFYLMGLNQYLRFDKKHIVFIVVREKLRIPIWLKKNDWGVKFQFKTSRLFDDDSGLEVFKRSKFPIIIASRERAVMEMIDSMDLSESFESLEQYFEGLTNIRASLTQGLLESCNSIKVKRVFLFMATKLDLPIIKKINISKVDLGQGKRVVVKSGVFSKEFNITVPRNYSEGRS